MRKFALLGGTGPRHGLDPAWSFVEVLPSLYDRDWSIKILVTSYTSPEALRDTSYSKRSWKVWLWGGEEEWTK